MKNLKTILVISVFSVISTQLLGQVTSNKQKLLLLSATKTAEFKLKKAEAEEYARQNNIPMTIETDSTFMELMFIDDLGMPQYYITANANAAKTISTNKVHPGGSNGFSLDGTGLTVHEWDAGAVLITHQEFGSRVTQGDGATSLHYHATHVAGTMIASGVDLLAKGMAPNINLRAFDWYNDESEMASEAASGALVSNHSIGSAVGWSGDHWFGNPSISTQEDYKFGFYDGQAKLWDEIAHDAPYYLIVKAAMNQRNKCGDGSYPCNGPYDCIDPRGIAKNILTVGAVHDIVSSYSEPTDIIMSSFSSWGPADDGRIKPDIVANGILLYSTYDDSNDDYRSLSGTSMSTPSATGSIILLQEQYENVHGTGNFMKAATLKALVIHSADEAGYYPGPDYEYGWGLMNTYKAVQLISNENGNDTIIDELTLTEGASYHYSYTNTSTEPLQVTIAWTDPPGTPPSPALDPPDAMLVNDLDLKVTESANTYYPWKLDRDNPSDMATNATENDADNVEMVLITNPIVNATYMVSVDHDGILEGGSQDFSIIISPVFIPDMTPPTALPEINWAKCFGGSDDDFAYSIVESFDGGHIVVGSSRSNDGDISLNQGVEDFLIVKIDNNGNKSWSKCFGGSGLDVAKSICKTYDSCFLIVGSTNSFNGDVTGNHGGRDLWLLKIDRNGNKIWAKCYGGSNRDYGTNIYQTNDSCYVLCGLSSSNNGDLEENHGSTDYWMLKLDRYGDKVWSKSFGGSNYENAQSIVQTIDSGYIMAGWSESNDGDVSGNHGQSDFWIIKTDKNGNKIWSKCFGGSNQDQAYSICHSFDSTFLVAGGTISNDGDVSGHHGAEDIWVIKLDYSGDTIWTKTFGGTFGDEGSAIIKTEDSCFIIAGISESSDFDIISNYGLGDYWVLKIKQDGDIIWSKNYGGSSVERATSVKLSTDYGAVIAGFSKSNDIDITGNHGLNDFWIVKLDAYCIPNTAPLYEDFETTAIGEIPDCWRAINTNPQEFSIGVEESGIPLNKELVFDIGVPYGPLMLITPCLDDLTMQDKQITFFAEYESGYWAFWGGDPTLSIGTLSNPYDPNTYTEYTEISVSELSSEYIIRFDSNYLLSDKYIAIKSGPKVYGKYTTFSKTWIDDILYEEIPDQSLEPATLPFIEDFETASGQRANPGKMFYHADRKWDYEINSNNEYHVNWGAKSSNPFRGEGAMTMEFNIDGLDPFPTSEAIVTLNMENYAYSTDLALSFYFQFSKYEDYYDQDAKVYVRGSTNDGWLLLCDIEFESKEQDTYYLIHNLDIDSVLSTTSPVQTVSSTFQLKFSSYSEFMTTEVTYDLFSITGTASNIAGTFTDSNQQLGTSGNTAIALGDMDNDGDLDAVITKDAKGQPNKVWLNDGEGIFTDSGLNFGQSKSWGLALGDLDDDGDLDGFVVNDGPNKVYLNDGVKTTDNGQNLGTMTSLGVDLADLDGDGDLDAVVANNSVGEPNKVWLNNGNGIFFDPGLSFGNAKSHCVALGDLDDDGDIDGFVANYGANMVYFNEGNYTTDNGQLLGTGYSNSVKLGDVDGDGDLDALVANKLVYQSNNLWLNDGDGYFTESGLRFGYDISMCLDLGDIDLDGDLDGFVANNGSNKVYLNDGLNTNDNGQLLGNSNSYGVALGDLDGDGDLDAFVANYDGPCKVWLNQTIVNMDKSKKIDASFINDEIAQTDYMLNNYPDPFRKSTTIEFKVPKTEFVVLRVYNSFGELEDVLYNGVAQEGIKYTLTFNAENLPSGIYILYLQSENGTSVKEKMLRIK